MPSALLKLTVALGALAFTAPAAFAGGSHDIGPHSKAQITALCSQEAGQLSLGSTSWGCAAKVWTIACVKSGKVCIIDLYGTLGEDGQTRSMVASVGPTLLTGTGGVGGAGGSTGGGSGGGGTGGFAGVAGGKVDTSGFQLSQTGNTGGGDTITTNGDHHDHGGGLQPL